MAKTLRLTCPGVSAKNIADTCHCARTFRAGSPAIPRYPMARQPDHKLSRRERQIMDIIYQRGQASAAEVLEDLPDPPSYSTIRALLRILEEKGHLNHKE